MASKLELQQTFMQGRKSNTSKQAGHQLSAGLTYQTGSENAMEALGTQEMQSWAINRQVTLGSKVTHHAD